jgi:hypothetical protein
VNAKLELFARTELRHDLQRCSEAEQRMFKLMYGRNAGKRNVEDTERMTIGEVVAEIPAVKLDWAMQQVANTLKKKGAGE